MLKLLVDSLDGLTEDVAKLYQPDGEKFRLSVDGVPDVDKLEKALRSERAMRDDLAKKLKQYDGVDMDEVKSLLAKFEGDEEAKLIKAGKIDEVLNQRTEKLRKDMEKRLAEAADATKAAQGKASKWTDRVLDNHIREAATKSGLHPYAIDDALLRAKSLFSLDDDGSAVQMKDGSVVFGKDGKTPFKPSEWLETMRESAPHWFPAPKGGGAAPSSQVRAGTKTMARSAFDQLAPEVKVSTVREGVQIID